MLKDKPRKSRVARIADEEMAAAIAEAGGRFAEIDFAEARRRWFDRLTMDERFGVIMREKQMKAAGEFERVQQTNIDYLRNLGCIDPPPPDPLH